VSHGSAPKMLLSSDAWIALVIVFPFSHSSLSAVMSGASASRARAR